MSNLFLVLVLAALAAAVAGLIAPGKLVFWSAKKTRLRAVGAYLGTALIAFVAFGVSLPPKEQRDAAQAPAATASPPPAPVAVTEPTKLAPARTEPEQYQTAGGYPACLSEDALEEASKALYAKDTQWFVAVKGCVLSDPGLKLVVVDRGFSRSKVRVFTADGKSLVVWTNSENIVRAGTR